MIQYVDRLPEPNDVGEAWLRVVRARFGAESKTAKVAGEVARCIKHDGRGELPSPINLSKPIAAKESVVIDAVNALIEAGLMRLKWRPFQRALSEFTVDPRRGRK